MRQEETAAAEPLRLPVRADAKRPMGNKREICALRLPRARNQAHDMRAGAERAHARPCETREYGTRRRQVAA